MVMVNIHEMKARFSHYAELAKQGQEVIVAKRNVPIAILQPYRPDNVATELVFGLAAGEFEVPEDFDEPLKEFEASFYQ